MEPRDEAYRRWVFTIPNMICMIRLVGSLALLCLALVGQRLGFVGLFVALTLSDWIDGRLARWLRQRSDLGARLDSLADAALYTAMLGGMLLLCYDRLLLESAWIATALASYLLTTVAGLIKYRRVPSYHTQAAKKTQAIVLISVVLFVLEIAAWPIRIAAVAVTLTNIEATLLTWMLPTWQADVSSLWKLLRQRKPR